MKPTGGAHILVVDDNAELCDLIRDGLAREGLTVEVAGSVAEARAAADRPNRSTWRDPATPLPKSSLVAARPIAWPRDRASSDG